MNNLLAAYILSFIGGLNWRFGLLSPASEKKQRRKNRMIWLKGEIVRVAVLFAIAWVILVHLESIQINSWWALFCWGVPYLLIAWVLNVYATLFEEQHIFNFGNDESSISDKMAVAWAVYFVGLFAIYVVVRVVVWKF